MRRFGELGGTQAVAGEGWKVSRENLVLISLVDAIAERWEDLLSPRNTLLKNPSVLGRIGIDQSFSGDGLLRVLRDGRQSRSLPMPSRPERSFTPGLPTFLTGAENPRP